MKSIAKRLASQLQNAAYNCGYEDAHPSNATTRQNKADARAREVLAALYVEIDRLANAAEAAAMCLEGVARGKYNGDAAEIAAALRASLKEPT